jgi:hypothetical protein
LNGNYNRLKPFDDDDQIDELVNWLVYFYVNDSLVLDPQEMQIPLNAYGRKPHCELHHGVDLRNANAITYPEFFDYKYDNYSLTMS